MNNTVVFLSIALFIVWMQRHKRWTLLYQAAQGNLVLLSSPVAGAALFKQQTNG